MDAHIKLGTLAEYLAHESADRLRRRCVAIDKVLKDIEVLWAEQRLTAGGLAVAAGPADLLREVLQTFCEVKVENGADIGLIDAHAKGDGCDDNGVRFPGEPFLDGGSVLSRH